MARPIKTKLDYFPIDCCDDNRIRLIEAKHGLIAYAVYVKLLQKIYGNKGYYMEWDEDIALLFSSEYHVPFDIIENIVNDMLSRGIFHEELFEKYGILTSSEIQQQYLFVIAKRKNKELDERFKLINSEETRVNSVDNTHSIAEDSIVEHSISEERRGRGGYHPPAESPAPAPRGKMNNIFLTEEEYGKLKTKYSDIDTLIDKLSLYMASTGKSYSSHYATLLRWSEEEKTKQPPPKSESCDDSYDIDEFFEAALRHSREKIFGHSV
ncbi:MAG: DUF4373 domain-containing protein [Clostridia bacterium]|nr:DUF4373 domain-containing protein [Clostridia bacterium]